MGGESVSVLEVAGERFRVRGRGRETRVECGGEWVDGEEFVDRLVAAGPVAAGVLEELFLAAMEGWER